MSVYFDTTRNKWRVYSYANGTRTYVGQYKTERGAKIALAKQRKQLATDTFEELQSMVYEHTPVGEPLFTTKPSLIDRIKAWVQ